MGEHRRDDGDGAPSRGVSKGPIIAVIAIVVVVLLVVGWLQLRDRVSDQGAEAAQTCVEGPASLSVTVDPDIAPQVTALAQRYDETKPVVRDHCVSTAVTAAASADVAAAVTATPAGPRPSLWIPTSSDAATSVTSTTGIVEGTPKSVATSPVVLAVPDDLARGLSEGAAGWADLPRFVGGQTTLDEVGLTGWGNLRLALPTGPDSGATTLAVHAVAAGLADATTAPLTAVQATSAAVVTGVSTLALAYRDAPGDKPTDTASALLALGGEATPATARIQAMPATEQQVFAARAAGSSVTAYRPAGVTPIADHPAVVLSGTDETQSSAAAAFVDFLREPAQQLTLSQAGYRVEDRDGTARAPADTRGLDYAAAFAPAPVPEPAAAAAVDSTLAQPVPPVSPTATTILLDVSGSMDSTDGTATRLQNTTRALTDAVGQQPDSTAVGLWVYSRNLNGSTAYRIAEPTGPLSENGRRAALTADLAGLRPATATSTYASVTAAYRAAVQNWVPGRPNSVLLITDGPNDDTSITSAQFLSALTSASDPAKPVRVDVVSLATNSDLATLRSAAGQTGGELVEVSSAAPDLGAGLSRLLGKQ